ncbi:hypothetical protein [Salmonella enterica]|uniref:Uncharacterized protein n=1 Tax=Salmonella enterica TaxID=28901 RepID=A0A701YWG5_SALER|nr:hypothetical protein [Salmonella enterica]HAC6565568.1 hypothetical protein [Salmonella enterica subsp. indica]HBC0160397.1 hypothetical protein [Salmonella enterica subsp. indica]HCM1936154.1 hypothetical protein [Salmonella enterica subsp. indica serovar 6,7:z41:1,7]
MSEPGAVTTEQCDAEDKTDEKEPMHCPLKDGGLILAQFDNEEEIDKFHKMVDSPLPPLFEGEEEKNPLPTGIPLESLQAQIEQYARMTGGSAIERALAKEASDILFMQELFDEIENILETERFLIFSLLFSSQAREKPNGGEFTIDFNGQKIEFEDAKFKMDFQERGGIITSAKKFDGLSVSHVYSTDNSLCTDDFTLKIFREMYIFSMDGMAMDANPINQSGADKEIIYDIASSMGLEVIGTRTRTAKELAQQIVDTTLIQVQKNRAGDIIRDVVIEIVDAIFTGVAIVTGTIAFKAAASAGARAVAAGYMLLSAGNLMQASETLANRMLGSPKEGYNPIKEAAKYLDKKAGTGHTVENCFDALNFIAVMGKTPAMQAFTGTTTASLGAMISVYSRGGDISPGKPSSGK